MPAYRTTDLDIRIALTQHLLALGLPRNAIRHEITLDSSSSDGRADIVVAHDTSLIGIEIKSGRDTLDRLKTQSPRYASRFDLLGLAHDPRHGDAAGKIDLGWRWQLIAIDDALDAVAAGPHSATGWIAHPSWKMSYSHVSSRAMLEMLHAVEVREICRALGSSVVTRSRGIPFLAETVPLKDLRPQIAQALRARFLNRWEEKFWAAFDAASNPAPSEAAE